MASIHGPAPPDHQRLHHRPPPPPPDAPASLLAHRSLLSSDPAVEDADSAFSLRTAFFTPSAVQSLYQSGVAGLRASAGGTPEHAQMAALLGNLLVVAAQIAAATQFVIEEKFLSDFRVPPLLAVGMEGTFGLLICGVGLTFMSQFECALEALTSPFHGRVLCQVRRARISETRSLFLLPFPQPWRAGSRSTASRSRGSSSAPTRTWPSASQPGAPL